MELTIANLFGRSIALTQDLSVLKNLQLQRIDWLQACGGKGRCTTCAMEVLVGAEHLSPPTAYEQRERQTGRLRPNERLACQCTAFASITVAVPDRYKLPHQPYGF